MQSWLVLPKNTYTILVADSGLNPTYQSFAATVSYEFPDNTNSVYQFVAAGGALIAKDTLMSSIQLLVNLAVPKETYTGFTYALYGESYNGGNIIGRWSTGTPLIFNRWCTVVNPDGSVLLGCIQRMFNQELRV